jgi:hypothetical protein
LRRTIVPDTAARFGPEYFNKGLHVPAMARALGHVD